MRPIVQRLTPELRRAVCASLMLATVLTIIALQDFGVSKMVPVERCCSGSLIAMVSGHPDKLTIVALNLLPSVTSPKSSLKTLQAVVPEPSVYVGRAGEVHEKVLKNVMKLTTDEPTFPRVTEIKV